MMHFVNRHADLSEAKRMSLQAGLISLLLVSSPVLANNQIDAEITGDRSLVTIGSRAEITLGNEYCSMKVTGKKSTPGYKPLAFEITLQCGNQHQVLWDINQVSEEEYAFDDPRFFIEWAGDRDGDGIIDLVMDMSPKYSCSKRVTYLSSLAGEAEIVGIAGKPEKACGC